MREAVLFDVDGTLADLNHRRVHLDKNDWDKFFDECHKDLLYTDMREILWHLQKKYAIVIVTGRPHRIKLQTEKWLNDNGISYDAIFVRADDDKRADYIIKQEMLKEIKRVYDVRFVFDDRKSVVNMWRENGLRCFQVNDGFDEHLNYVDGAKVVMMVGPSGGGKTTYVEKTYPQSVVLSSDKIREELTGDFQNQSENTRVFAAMRNLLKARLESGMLTVIDATNLKRKDRRSFTELVPTTVPIEYVVINRPMEDKIKTAGWRDGVVVKGKPLLEYHEEVFNNNIKDILNGDDLDNVTVIDLRS